VMRTSRLLMSSSSALLLVCTAALGVASAGTPAEAEPVNELGPLETVAGTGGSGHSGDGGPAVDADLGDVRDLAFDEAGNLYIASRVGPPERGAYIRRVAPDGTISTVAGGSREPSEEGLIHITPDGLGDILGVAPGPDGEVYIANGSFGQIMRLDPGEEPAVVAGTGDYGHAGDGGPATSAQFDTPVGVSVGEEGEIYVVDAGGYIRRIGADGVITTIAGTGEAEASSGDGGPAVEASFTRPMDVELDADGNLYVTDVTRFKASDDDIPSHRIRRIGTDGVITTVAGGETCGYTGDGGPAEDAELCFPRQIAVSADGTIYLTDARHRQIRVISPDGTINTLPVYVEDPSALVVGPDGALYVGDGEQGQVHRIPLDASAENPDVSDTPTDAPDRWADSPPHVIAAVAGTGTAGFSGDDGPAADVQVSGPEDLAVGPDGTLYVLDAGNDRVRAIDPDAMMTTVAGNGASLIGTRGLGPMEGDGRRATEVGIGASGIDVAGDGTLFMADRQNGRVRKVSPAGVITRIAGTGERPDDDDTIEAGAVATRVAFDRLHDVAVAPDGGLYVSDLGRHQVFHIGVDGTVHVAAGTGSAGFSGDGGPAAEAELERPTSLGGGAARARGGAAAARPPRRAGRAGGAPPRATA
jgi:sugar lactone lactonase YvrE